MKIVVVDDEKLARERLSSLLAELGEPYQLVGEAANGMEVLELLERQPADLVLMDIRMPGIDGLTAAKHLASGEMPPAVIFTTAFEGHALQAFESEGQDYLLKPVRKERLLQALEKAQKMNRVQWNAHQTGSGSTPMLHSSYRGGLQTMPLDEVIYLRADNKYVIAKSASGELLLDESLKSLQENYKEWFLRIHRNALVSYKALAGLKKGPSDGMLVVLRGCDDLLDVSRRHLPEVRRVLRGK